MTVFSRISLLAMLALLGACSQRAVIEPVAPVQQPATSHMPAAADDVLFRALGLVGTPYRYGGNTPETGFDCSGLIGYVYREGAGLRLPRSTRELIAMRAPDVSRGNWQSGDLVFFATSGGRTVSHAGIYVGEGRFVHAPSSGGTVRLDKLSDRYWSNAYLGAKRPIVQTLASHP